jgi:outer membrane protein assembly factor BamB
MSLAASNSKIMIPWGNGPGQLSLGDEKEAVDYTFRGPSSIASDGKSIYILDVREPAVEIFSFDGTYEASMKLPPASESVSADYSDLALGSDGTVYVLEADKGIVYRVNRSSGVITPIKIPGSKHATGYTTLTINNDVLSAFDTFSGKIIQFGVDGKSKSVLTSMLFENLVSDKDGNFYGASIRGGQNPNPKQLTLWKLDPVEKKKSVAGSFESDKEINSYAVVGIDKSGRIYATAAFGGADVTEEEKMLVFSQGQKPVRSFNVPSVSYKVTMTRQRAISSDGRILICRPMKSGLQLFIVGLTD